MLRQGLPSFSKRLPQPTPSRSFSNVSWNKFDTDRFELELSVHGPKYADFDAVNKSIPPPRKKTIIDIYQNTVLAPLPLIVIGPSQSLWTPITLFNFGGSSSTPWWKALQSKHALPDWERDPQEVETYEKLRQLIQLKPDHLTQGSIMVEAFWGIAENEAFTMGAIDSGKEVHIASKANVPSLIAEKDLWSTDYGMSVLSHELITLLSSGCKVAHHSYSDLGLVVYNEKGTKHKDMGELMTVKEEIKKGGFDKLIKFFESVSKKS
jgi:hypothetical protein